MYQTTESRGNKIVFSNFNARVANLLVIGEQNVEIVFCLLSSRSSEFCLLNCNRCVKVRFGAMTFWLTCWFVLHVQKCDSRVAAQIEEGVWFASIKPSCFSTGYCYANCDQSSRSHILSISLPGEKTSLGMLMKGMCHFVADRKHICFASSIGQYRRSWNRQLLLSLFVSLWYR